MPYSPSQIASRASIGLLLVVFAIAVLSFGSPASAAPPAVQPDRSAQSNCQSIVNAGYSPNDYVLRGGKWRYEPGYSGTNSVRMSSLWGSASTCRNGSTIQPKIRIVVTPPKIRRTEPAPQRQGQNQVVQDPVIHDPDPEPKKRREQERDYQPSHRTEYVNTNDKCTNPDNPKYGSGCYINHPVPDYEAGGRADPNKKNITLPKSKKKVKNPRVELSGQEWYNEYGSEHPFGAGYGGPDNPDPNFGCDNVYGPGFSDVRCGRD